MRSSTTQDRPRTRSYVLGFADAADARARDRALDLIGALGERVFGRIGGQEIFPSDSPRRLSPESLERLPENTVVLWLSELPPRDVGRFPAPVWCFVGGDPRAGFRGPIAGASSLGRIGITLCRLAEGGRGIPLALEEVPYRPWDGVDRLQRRLDRCLPILVRSAERSEVLGQALPPVPLPAEASRTLPRYTFRDKIRDRKYQVGTVARMLSPWIVSRRVTRLVTFHNPVPDILDDTLGLLAPLGPFLSYSQVVTAMQAGHNPPPGTVVTFDDGYKQNMAVLEVLERHSCRAIFFVSTAPLDSDSLLWFMNPDLEPASREQELRSLSYQDFLRAVDGYGLSRPSVLRGGQGLTSEEVRVIIDRGHEVGIHTHHHPFLTRLTKDELEEEIGISRERLARAVGAPGTVVDLAFPDGAYNDTVLSVVRGLGLRSACSTNPGTLGGSENLFALPRFVLDDADYAGFALFKLTGVYRTLKTMRAGRHRA